MAPMKKAKIGQGANATSGVADESLLDTAGEGSRPAITLPGPPIPEGAIQMLTQLAASQAQRSSMVAFAQATENRKLKNRIEREGNRKTRSAGNIGESLAGGRSAFWGGLSGTSQSVAQSSASAPPSGPSQQQQWSRFRPSQGNRGSYQRGLSGEWSQQQQSPLSSSRYPAPAWRGAARGGEQSLGGPSRFYAMSGRQTAEASPDIFTGILNFQSHDVYALIDPGSTMSYVTPFIAIEFGIEPEQLHEPFL
ncbi:PREDICTED: uncharacterized protein LOC109214552, partial [Nicotiana attenuata]|uniref:uncharacterized protein LOC109214552 n=1 Tax=Nicotiana attenuata TaxID=49451 RepID=UPI000904C0B0